MKVEFEHDFVSHWSPREYEEILNTIGFLKNFA